MTKRSTSIPAAALARLHAAFAAKESARLQYEALVNVAIEALGYDPATEKVRLDLETGSISVDLVVPDPDVET